MAKNDLRRTGKITSSKSKRVQINENLNISVTNHDKLLKHIESRLQFGNELRESQIERFEIIDREIAGYIRLDEDDRKRERDNILGKGPKVTDTVLPLTIAQLDEAVTFLLSVIAPDDGIYQAIAVREKQEIAKAFANLMNKNAKQFGHYRHMARALFEMMKYNFGALTVEWRNVIGKRIASNADGSPKVENTVVASGNSVEVADVYNLIYDVSVNPVELSSKGEFFALIDVKTPFRVKKMEADKQIFDIDRFIKNVNSDLVYYEIRPTISNDHSNRGQTSGRTNWIEVLSAGTSQDVRVGIEEITYYGWINPRDFGLSKADEFQIWRFTVMANKYIVLGEELNNAHGMLPINIGMPWEDGFDTQTKSYAEHLAPYQRFASFQLNVHQRSARKKLYGVTFYNSRILPALADADMQSAKIPFLPPGQDFDIRKAILQFTDGPDTQNTMQDIASMDDLMQKVLPTDMLKQVASLERATQYQAAATVQGGNRRNLKIAKIINIQCFEGVRQMQMFNIFQFQQSVEMLDPNGQLTEINPAEFRDSSIEFDISDGLKGIDKLIIIEGFKDIINMMLQSQIAQDRIDIVAIIDYWTSLLGEKTDFTQFKFADILDKLSGEERQLAIQIVTQAFQKIQQTQQQEAGVQGLPVPTGGIGNASG